MSSKSWHLEIQNAQTQLQSAQKKHAKAEAELSVAKKRLKQAETMYRKTRQTELQNFVETVAREMISMDPPPEIMRTIGASSETDGWQRQGVRLIVRIDPMDVWGELVLSYKDGDQTYTYLRHSKAYPIDMADWFETSVEWAKSALYDWLSVSSHPNS